MLADLIPKLAVMGAKPEQPYRPRPSSAGPERCIRQMVFHGLEIPRDPLPGRALLIFDDSSWHEELTADWLRTSAYKVHSEQMEVEHTCLGLTLKGHIDFLVTDPTPKDRLCEHKAINHFTFQRFLEPECLPLDYLTQCAIYLAGLNHVNPDILTAILLIKNKNTSQYLEWVMDYNPEADILRIDGHTNTISDVKTALNIEIPNIVTDAYQKFLDVDRYIKEETLPKRPWADPADDWRCSYCGWSERCWSGWEAEVEALGSARLPQLEDDVSRYFAIKEQRLTLDKEEKALKKSFKSALAQSGASQATAGGYVLTNVLQRRKEFTVAETSFLKLDIKKRRE